MNRSIIAAVGVAALLAVFVGAMAVYEGREEAPVEPASAASSAAPYVRDYSPTLGPDSAKVVLVEFFDPG